MTETTWPAAAAHALPGSALSIRSRVLFLIGIVGLSALLGLFRLDALPLWNDEAFSILTAQDGLIATIRYIINDNQPPLYYVALSQWLQLGDSIFWIRALSVLATAAATLLVAQSARIIFGWNVALLAGLLCAVSPHVVMWSQKARPYPLQLMFCALAFWGIAAVVQRVLAGGGAERAGLRSAGWAWAAYAVGAAGAMLAQHTAAFFLLSLNLGAILAVWTAGVPARRWLLHWLLAQCGAVALWSLWLPGFVVQITRLFTSRWTVENSATFFVSPRAFSESITTMYGADYQWGTPSIVLAIYVVLFLLAARLWRGRRPWVVLLATAGFLPLLLSFAGWIAIHPVFGYALGTFIWLCIPLSILVAGTVMTLPSVWLRTGVIALLLLIDARGVFNYYRTQNVPLDAVAQLLAREARSGDAVVFARHTGTGCGIRYYMTRAHAALPPGVREACADGLEHPENGRLTTAADLRPYARIWAVTEAGDPLMVDPAAPPLSYRKTYDVLLRSTHVQRYEPVGTTH